MIAKRDLKLSKEVGSLSRGVTIAGLYKQNVSGSVTLLPGITGNSTNVIIGFWPGKALL